MTLPSIRDGAGSKPIKRIAGMMVLIVLAFGVVPSLAFAETEEGDASDALTVASPALQTQADVTAGLDYTYNAENHTATVSGFSGTASGSLVIPSTVTEDGAEYTVTAIGDDAFANQVGFTDALVMPDTIESIGARAFEGCSGFTGDMVLPANLKTIGAAAFKNCKNLKGTWSLPSGLTSLGEEAFYDCVGMTGTLTIPAGIKSIPAYCFYLSGHYSSGSYISVPNNHGVTGLAFADGSQLESVGDYAFHLNWYIKGGLAFPASVKTIGNYAFYDTGVRAAKPSGGYIDPVGTEGPLNLPADVESIGEYAFAQGNFDGSLTIPNTGVAIGKGAFNSAGFNGTLTIQEGVESIPEECFEGCEFCGTLQLPSTLKTIGKSAFWGCQYFDGTLTIPAGVTEISDHAFARFAVKGPKGELTLPSGLKTIGASAFETYEGGCFTGPLNIPDSVEAIGERAFNGCRGFTSLKLPNNEKYTTIADETFSSGSSYNSTGYRGSLSIPESVTTIGNKAFYYCGCFDGELTLPANITSIGDSAFDHCDWFTGSLVLPSGLKTIGDNAFCWCEGLTGLSIPESVETIGESAFFGCEKMTGSLAIPGNVQTVSNSAFRQFGSKSANGVSLTIGNNVKTIEDYAFCNSGFVGDIVIPDSVTSLGRSVFSGCSKLTGYTLPDALTTVPEGLFSGCSNLEGNLALPASVESIGRDAFRGCSKLTGVLAIPQGVTSIGSSAFNDCSGLSGNLDIPNGITMIGDEAFKNCSGLIGALTIPADVTYIGSSAFEGCSGFTGTLTIPSKVKTLYSSAFEGCSGFTALDMQQKATSLPYGLFANCTGLTGDVVIPDGVTTLGGDLFYGCSNLKGTLTIPSSVTRADSENSLATSGFTSIVNNSTQEFFGPAIALGTVDYFANDSGEKVQTLGSGTYTRKTQTPVDISAASVSDIPDVTYNGDWQYPEPVVTLNGTKLVKGEHYTLGFSDNKYVGTATLFVEGFGYNGYTGAIEKKFNIKSAGQDVVDISGATVVVPAQTYTGSALEPAPTVTLKGTTLTPGTHYTTSYENNTNAGTATVKITGVESAGYSGTATGTFSINAKKVTPTVTLSKTSFVYNGKAQKPAVTVKVDGAAIAASGYTVTWPSGCKNAGTYRVKVTLKGNYSGEASASFKVTAKRVTPAVTLSKASFVYNGKAQKPAVTVKVGNVKLGASGYKVTWPSGCKNVGKYAIKVALKGNYSGSKAASFTIVPKGTAISQVAAASKGFTVKWKKQATQTSGYQVQYSLKSNFASSKAITVKGAKAISKKVSKLKGKKKYYVRVRTYKQVGKTSFYSSWSKAKAVTTKA